MNLEWWIYVVDIPIIIILTIIAVVEMVESRRERKKIRDLQEECSAPGIFLIKNSFN